MLKGSRLFCSSIRSSRRRHRGGGDGGGDDARVKPRYGHKTTVNFLANLEPGECQGDIFCPSSHFRQSATHFQIKEWKSCKFQTTFTPWEKHSSLESLAILVTSGETLSG